MRESEKIKVYADPDLRDIIPLFLAHKREEIEQIRQALLIQDFKAVFFIAHQIKGSGGGYGFDAITEIGKEIEEAAAGRNEPMILKCMDKLADYLERIEVVYE